MVTAIVCAYNEEKTVRPILEVLLSHPRIDEVIAVDDGSTDETRRAIYSIINDKLVKIHHRKNLGKGASVVDAVKRSISDILLFFDADLKKFHPGHVDLLLKPLDINPKCMTIGIWDSHLPYEKHIGSLLKSFGGQRALSKHQILSLMKRVEKSGYGVEAIINLHFLHHHYPIYYIPLPGLLHVLKQEKHPIYKFIVDYFNEGAEIVKQFLSPENKTAEIFLKKIIKKLKV